MASSFTTENVKVGNLEREIPQERDVKFSAEQEEQRQLEAQHLLQQLRVMLVEGEMPRLEALNDLLSKGEELLSKSTQKSDIDSETRKILEDIDSLLVSAKELERNKGILDKLQKIAEESKKAIETISRSEVSAEVKKASQETVDWINIWRPVFQLLIRSREFRQLFVDSVKIARCIVSRKSEGILDEIAQPFFIEGDSTKHTKEILEEVKEKYQEERKKEELTNEEWEKIHKEIQRVLTVLAREPTFHDAINRMFTLFDMWRSTFKETLPKTSEGKSAESHIRQVQLETEKLVASFTGRETLEQFEIRLSNLIDVFDNNLELKQYFRELKELILSTKSAEEVQSEEFKQKSKDLAHRGSDLINQLKDVNEVDQFLRAAEELVENIMHDEFVNLLYHQAGIVKSDLSYVDTEGNVQVDTNMLSKLQSVLLPILADTLKYIPLPRIENSNSNRDFWLDNIVLCGFDIIPENIRIHLESDTDISVKDIRQGTRTRFVIRLDNLRTELKNMKFYYNKKTFPQLEDSGIVHFRIGGKGARLYIAFTIVQKASDSHPRLTEGYADFHIRNNMDIEFDKSTIKHDVLLPMLTAWFKLQIRKEIEKEVEKNLTNVVQQLGDRLTQALSELNRPLLSGIDTAKQAIKESHLAQVAEMRRERLAETVE